MADLLIVLCHGRVPLRRHHSQLLTHWCPSERVRWCQWQYYSVSTFLTVLLNLRPCSSLYLSLLTFLPSFSETWCDPAVWRYLLSLNLFQLVSNWKCELVVQIFWPFSDQVNMSTFRWVPTSEKPVFLSFAYVGGTFGTIITYPVKICWWFQKINHWVRYSKDL